MASGKVLDRYPPGYIPRREAACRLGVSEKTVDRRLRTQGFARILRVGCRVYLREEDVESYFRLSKERGYI